MLVILQDLVIGDQLTLSGGKYGLRLDAKFQEGMPDSHSRAHLVFLVT